MEIRVQGKAEAGSEVRLLKTVLLTGSEKSNELGRVYTGEKSC